MTISTAFLGLRPRFVYGTTGNEVDVSLQLPCRPWGRRSPTVGGSRVAAAGVPGAYVVRRDHVLLLPLRFYESEWPDVDALVTWGQLGESLLWYPDANVVGVSSEVWLHSPAAGDDYSPSRMSSYQPVLELTLELRSVAATVWSIGYYDNL